MEQSTTQRHPGQHFQGENHALDQVGLVHHQARGPVEHIGKQIEHQQPGKHLQCKLLGAVRAARPAGLEHLAKDKGVRRQNQQGIEQRPAHAQYRALVTRLHITPR